MTTPGSGQTPPVLEDRRPGPGRLVGFATLFLVVAAGIATLSAFPWAANPAGVAVLKVAFKHVAAPAASGPALSREELEKLPRHMRPQGGQSAVSGHRRDTIVRVALDGRPVLEKTYRPGGLRHDGPTFVYEEIAVTPGPHVLAATLAESRGDPAPGDGPSAPERRLVADVDVRPGHVLLLELSDRQELTLRQGGITVHGREDR